MKFLLFFACLYSAFALNRDAPSTKNTAIFDLIVLLARKNQIASTAALDALAEPLEAQDLISDLKDLIFEKLLDKFGNSSFISKLPSPLPPIPPSFKEKKLGCKICTAISKGVKVFIMKSDNYTLFENTIIKACHILFNKTQIQKNIYCDGLIKLHLPHIYYVIKTLRLLQLSEFCPYMNACVPPKAVARSSGKTEEPKMSKVNFDKNDVIDDDVINDDVINDDVVVNDDVIKDDAIDEVVPLRVVQLADIHLEQNYQENSNTDCGLPVCCLQKYGNGNAGYYGDYKCNIPLRTIKNFLSKVYSMKPDIILYSGDTPPHTIWEETSESQINCAKVLTEMIAISMPNTTVYPCIGNHEPYPTNLFSYKNLNYTKIFTREFLNYWKPIANLSNDQNNNILKGGFYTTLIKKNLRLIVLNTNYWYVFNWYNILNDLYPPKETKTMQTFLTDTLKKARKVGEKVILMSHHVPGNADYIIKFSRFFEDTIIEFSDIITLMPVGHTHLDEFRMIYDRNGIAKSVVLVSPSVTTLNLRNPSIRVFELHPDTYELLDYQQLYLDLVTMNDYARNNGPVDDITNFIKVLYNAKATYNMADLSPSSWEQLSERLESDHDLLLKHASYSTAEGDTSDSICLSRCSQRYVCRMRTSNFDEFLSCLVGFPTLPANFTSPSFPQVTRSDIHLPAFEIGSPRGEGSALRVRVLVIFVVFAILYYI